MKIPSVQQILQASGRTFFRFPAVLLDAIAGTAVGIVIIEQERPAAASGILFKVLFAAILGIPLLTAVTLTAEKKKWGRPAFLGALAVALLLLVAYAASVPADPESSPEFHAFRLMMLAVALLLLVAFAPFTARVGINGFWQYNKELCLRIIIAFLFSMVLYAGLALALAALDNLFGIEIVPKRYFQLWVFIAGVFATWVFLAGVPEDLDALEDLTDYPKVLKIFAQYILLPLVLIYLAILYAYVGKILVEWSWPRGWVSGLILGYATAGMLLLLLLHPIRDRAENAWMKSASPWFHLSMVPLIVMLFLAMSRRISEYGITEGRYIGLALAVWLAAMVAYFLISRSKSIKVIPASLCVATLAISFGPWGAFEVSQSSQVGRLRALLEDNSLLADGKVQKVRDTVSFSDRRQISSIIGYLHDVHGYDRIQPWFNESLTHDTSRTGTRAIDAADVMKMLGIEFVAVWEGERAGDINLNSDRHGIADVAGYDRLVHSQYIDGTNPGKTFPDEGVSYSVNPGLDTLTFVYSPLEGKGDSLTIGLRPLVDRLLVEYANLGARDIPAERMSMDAEGPGLKVRVFLKSLRVRRLETGVKLTSYEVEILYSTRRDP